MTRRTVPRRRRVVVAAESGARRTIKAPSSGAREELALDDCPLAVARSADARHLIVTMPYEVWIVDAKRLSTQRAIPLTMARPSVVEGWEGALWIGGQHMYRGSVQSTSASKVGTKLGGYVDHLCLVRDDLLCGVGAGGEMLWDIDREGPVHKRKSTGAAALAVVASADGRAVYCDGTETAWVIDPAHTEGYAQLRMSATSSVSVESEGIVCLGRSHAGMRGTRGGRLLLAARDGAVAWTSQDLRLAGERVPAGKRDMTPLAITADERWVYVLRRRGVVQRFLIAQPGAPRRQDAGGKGKRKKGKRRSDAPAPTPEVEVPRLPEAQQARLGKLASCMSLLVDEGKRSLMLGGPRADGALGRLWSVDPESLEWEELSLRARELVEPPEPDPDAEPPPPQKPSFIATKNKLSGAKISTIAVDDIVGSRVSYWVTHGSGSLLERPTAQLPVGEILPGDALLLPAMVRFAEGTARPGLLLWPGVVEDHKAGPPPPQLLAWGDDPRAWMSLETPQIRKQKWSRTDVFPVQVAIAAVPESLPGKRQALDPKWIDATHFAALAKECKKQLKVLW